jgi:hypothetical protein
MLESYLGLADSAIGTDFLDLFAAMDTSRPLSLSGPSPSPLGRRRAPVLPVASMPNTSWYRIMDSLRC